MTTPVRTATKVPARPAPPASLPGRRPPEVPSPRRTGTRSNWRKTVFRLHGWIGLNTGLLLFVICFSGSIATVSSEIDRLLNPAMRADVQDAPYAWTEMHESVRAAFPEGTTLGIYAPLEPGFAALAYVALPTGQTRKVYLHPHTGALQGHTSFFNVHRFFRSFHRRFFDGYRGITIVTLTGFVLLASALSGLLFYKGWLKQLLTLRRKRGLRLLWSDLHKTGGIWALLFTLLIALTGIFYFVEEQIQTAGRSELLQPPPLPDVDPTSLDRLGPQPDLFPASTYAAAARRAFPDLEIRSMRMPQSPGDPVYVDGQAGNPITRDRANKVLLHPFTAEVIGVQRSSDLGVVPFITDAVDPLHFGYFGGLPTKLLWLALGLLLSFSVLSGTYLWVVRLGTGRRGQTSFWLRGASVSIAITLAYFVVVAFATIDGIRIYAPQQSEPAVVREIDAGPYRVAIECEVPCRPPEGARYRVQFLRDGLPNYASISLQAGSNSATVLQGPSRSPSGSLHSAYGATVHLHIKGRDGGAHTGHFAAPVSAILPASDLPVVPDTTPGVWWVVAVFVGATAGFIGLWLYFVVQALVSGRRRIHHAERPTSSL